MTQALEPMELFLNSIGNPETRRQYRNKLKDFFAFIGMEGVEAKELAKEFASRALKEKQYAFSCVVSYLSHQRQRYENKEIVAGTFRNYYKPIKIFCEANDIDVTWKRITRGLPKSRKFALDRAPTTEEIRRLLEYPDRRIRAIVLVMSASGIRIGAWDWLKWKHIEPVLRDRQVIAAKMHVYAGENEEYKTFITPEAYHSVKQYMDFRAEHGEKIGPDSWVMRDIFKTTSLNYGANIGTASLPRRLQSKSMRNMLKRAWISQGVLTVNDESKYEFKSSHGFRKRFKTQCELAGVKPLNVECMLGHDTGISGSAYYRPTDQELLQDYLRATPALQISETFEVKQKLAEKEKEYQNHVQNLRQQVATLQDQVTSLISAAQIAIHEVERVCHPSR
jgi:integrase